MKKKIFFALGLIGFLGICFATTISAKSTGQSQEHRVYPEFKQLEATDVEIVKKASLPGKGKPAHAGGGKPDKNSSGSATGILGQPLPKDGTRYAIVIGIANYPGTANDLRYPDEDAEAMRDVLINQYEFLAGNIRFLVDEGDGETEAIPTNATAQNIRSAILETKGLATADDEVVFFYSGHGGKGMANDGDKEKWDESIISHDWILNETTGELEHKLVHIWDGQLQEWFAEFPTKRIIFFFDSCVAGGMTDLAETGRVINMATEEKRFDSAVELDSLGYGEFTYYFVIKGMGKGLADIYDHNENGFLKESVDVIVEEAFDYAKANTNYDHPTISDMFTDDLAL